MTAVLWPLPTQSLVQRTCDGEGPRGVEQQDLTEQPLGAGAASRRRRLQASGAPTLGPSLLARSMQATGRAVDRSPREPGALAPTPDGPAIVWLPRGFLKYMGYRAERRAA
jgi:hypothetical protein